MQKSPINQVARWQWARAREVMCDQLTERVIRQLTPPPLPFHSYPQQSCRSRKQMTVAATSWHAPIFFSFVVIRTHGVCHLLPTTRRQYFAPNVKICRASCQDQRGGGGERGGREGAGLKLPPSGKIFSLYTALKTDGQWTHLAKYLFLSSIYIINLTTYLSPINENLQ